MSHALIPGSFDPITNGHMDIITRVSARFESVTVAVMDNDMHLYCPDVAPKYYMFSILERRAMVQAACAHLPNVTVIAARGRLIDLFDTVGADWLIKGVRSVADFEYEQTHALYNRAHNPRVETLYMPADPALDALSSTLVRARIKAGDRVEAAVPAPVIAWMDIHPAALARALSGQPAPFDTL